MRELVFEELTTEQKLGMVMTAQCRNIEEGDFEFALDLIRRHALGAVWVLPGEGSEERMRAVHEAADYPILIVTDAESGLDPWLIGHHGALGLRGDVRCAYAFGKVTAVTARNMGYTLVCNPVVDMTKRNVPCCGTIRDMGSDPAKVSELAVAVAKGMHDGGVLCMAKHFPSSTHDIDTHMAEAFSDQTEQDLLDYNLKPYLAMLREGVLDSVMTGHQKLPKIDDRYPASLSRKVLGILRRQGFDGVMMTDALCMMGIMAKFGRRESKGLAIAQGNDLTLGWTTPNREDYEALKEAYVQGILSPERLDEAVRHVLAMQHKLTLLPKDAAITPEDEELFTSITRDGFAAVTDEGISPTISRDGRHFFILLEENLGLAPGQTVPEISVATFSSRWYQPDPIEEKIRAVFPNSTVQRLNEFPTEQQNLRVLEEECAWDDVVFVTFNRGNAYQGAEHFTSRVLSVIEAMQVTNRVSAILHFGNPFLLEETVHIPRRFLGSASRQSTLDGIEVLAGLYPASGTIPYDLKLR